VIRLLMLAVALSVCKSVSQSGKLLYATSYKATDALHSLSINLAYTVQ